MKYRPNERFWTEPNTPAVNDKAGYSTLLGSTQVVVVYQINSDWVKVRSGANYYRIRVEHLDQATPFASNKSLCPKCREIPPYCFCE